MWRVKLLPAVLGFFLLIKGCDERKLSSSGGEPIERSFAQLEDGELPDSDYVRFTEGVAIYSLGILKISKDGSFPSPDDSVKWFYYPVISPDHNDLEGVTEFLEDTSGKRRNYRVQGLQVLVKTDQYDTVGDLPVGMEEMAAIEGTVINKISPLGLEESQLLEKSFPRVASGKVLVLELGREPSGFFGYALYFLGGLLLFLASGAWIIIGLSRAELPEA